jgi:SAM-dependent methyltransferase
LGEASAPCARGAKASAPGERHSEKSEATARTLARLTSEFYAEVAPSFSQTRQEAWPGWERVVGVLAPTLSQLSGHGTPLRVLDLACGNLRFERYLERRLPPSLGIEAYAYDACDELVAKGRASLARTRLHYRHVQLGVPGEDLCAPHVHLAVCFGFLHHLPLVAQREHVIDALVEATVAGGVVALAFWQPSKSKRLRAKMEAFTAHRASELGITDLDRGDYLLGWQERSDVARYCHDFSEQEIDALLAGVAGRATEVARFSADGGDKLNRYVLLQRN